MPSRPLDAVMALRRHLNRSLFIESPRLGWRLGRPEAAVLVVSLVLLVTVLQLLRIGPGIAFDSLWAEDGPIFLQGAIQHSAWTDLTTTYGGYLVVVQRLIGLAANLLPLREAPLAFSLLSGIIVGAAGIAVWFASAAHIRSSYLRGTLVALTVLAPTASLESVANGTYVTWFMLLPVFWMLICRPRTTGAAVLGGGFILLTALSTPGVWFFAPLAALRALAIRDRRDGILVSSWALGLVIQVPAYLLQNEPQVEPLWSHDIWTAYLQRVLDGAAFGERLGGAAWELLGWPLLIALLAAGLTGLYLGLRRSDAAGRWLAALALPTSLAMFVVSVYQRAVGPQMKWLPDAHAAGGGRYTIVPALLLVSLVLVLVDGAARRLPRRGRWLAAAAAAILLAGMAISFDVRDPAARGTPPWDESLDAVTAQCQAEGLAEAPAAISPPPFAVVVPCDEAAGG